MHAVRISSKINKKTMEKNKTINSKCRKYLSQSSLRKYKSLS